MATKSLILAMFVISMTTQVHSCGFTSQRLVEFIAGKSNPDVIPQETTGKPVQLKLAMALIDVKDVDQRRNEAEIIGWLGLEWNTGITFDPEEYNDLHFVRLRPSKMWVPDIAVYNGDMEVMNYVGGENIVIRMDGRAAWILRSKIRVWCDVSEDKLNHNATCGVKIASWSRTAQTLSLDEHPSLDFNLDQYNEYSKYKVTNVSARREVKTYTCCPDEYQSVIFTFSFVKK